MDLHAAREQAFWLAWRKGLQHDPRGFLPGLLDDLERIDREQVPDGIVRFSIDGVPPATDAEAAEFARQWLENHGGGPPVAMSAEPRPPTDAELTAWIEANPEKFAAWVRRQNRINGAPPATAKPQTRRRTPRKADG